MTSSRAKPPPMFLVPVSAFDGSNGICLACGEIQYGGVEPDAREYACAVCLEPAVFGVEEALLTGRVTLVEEDSP